MDHLEDARTLIGALRATVERACAHLAAAGSVDGKLSVARLDEHQAVVYDLASVASAVPGAEELLAVAEDDAASAPLAHAFAADVLADLLGRAAGRWAELVGEGTQDLPIFSAEVTTALERGRSAQLLATIADDVVSGRDPGRARLSEEHEMVRATFRRFAEDRVVPVAEDVHRHDQDIPQEIIDGLAELGAFALSIPSVYGGMSEGGEDELLNMVLVTEELSRGSLGVAGSLITRPEIITTAILRGGTEEQKQRWLPQIAAGERMCAVAVTEPDFGSDVAGIKTTATRDGDDWILNGVKTWCTFGGRAQLLLVLARTDPDRAAGHRGLSLFVVEKPSFAGHEFRVEQDGGGVIDARAIPTIGYRGMHSFEVSFEGWRVPHADLIGEDDGTGRGFYLQMQAFASGRLQTAARALGVMEAALDAAATYARERQVFGVALADYQLSKVKLARMALLIAACRHFTFRSARLLAKGEGQLEASMVKALSCRAAEWVTREAMQLHGGMGYAEEFAVSRYFVDARVLSIFEGADEVLALRVIARTLLEQASTNGPPAG